MKKILTNTLGFIGYSFRERAVLLSIISYILIIISPFLSWYSTALVYTGVDEELKVNMFQLAGGQFKEKSFIVLGIFTIVVGCCFLAIEYLDFGIKLRSRLRACLLIEIILYIILIAIIVCSLNNETVRQIVTYREGEVEALVYWIKDARGHCNRGVGPIVYISGLSLAILSKVGIYVYYFIEFVKESLTIKKG